ncbi:hypothetical protein EDC96DRAFT_510303 [Choanephora cucurbitarum]|nr:hypothetical protein EDC96DRAFT_510303 [Choanephora cucurbitarum]
MSYQQSSPLRSVSSEEWAKFKTQSTSSAAYSVSSSSSRQTTVSIQESYAKQYYVDLKRYLHDMLAAELAEGVPPQRTTARQKLSRLNNLQFHELATDVYDEMMRRQSDNKSYLPRKDEYHSRRNQAREKLSTLPLYRFQDLASDVYHELRRRYPQIMNMEEEDVPPMPTKSLEPQAHPSQSTNIVPVKGMISVENVSFDDDEGRPTTEPENLQSLDSLMADLGNMVQTPNDHSESRSSNIETMRHNYELKISSMAKRIKMLELSLNNEQSHGSDSSPSMRLRQMQQEYDQLDKRYNQLSQDHQEQQMAVREVKNEMKQLIEEIKSLSSKNEALRVEKEKADAQIKTMTDEMKAWKRKYETVSMELRSFKVKSISLENANVPNELLLKPSLKGAIAHQYIIDFQTAIDELMKTSRSSKPTDVLMSMRVIVMACKAITTEVENHETKVELPPETRDQLYDIKKRFSDELTSLLAASKSYASGMGITPVSLIDASASNLTNTIVDLVRLLGMKPIESFQSEPSHQPSSQHNNIMKPKELSQFLKTETDHIVSSVQSLLSALRSSDDSLYNIITSIIDIVSNIVHTSRITFSNGEGIRYQNQGHAILSDLDNCNNKIVHIRDTSFAHSPQNANAIAKRNLAQESYEIAKYTKELIRMLDM